MLTSGGLCCLSAYSALIQRLVCNNFKNIENYNNALKWQILINMNYVYRNPSNVTDYTTRNINKYNKVSN